MELVFTRDGKPITGDALRKAFDAAKEKADIIDFHFHDFRHTAVTRWMLAGIPEELRMIGAGHKRRGIHQEYVNPPDAEMVRIFSEKLGWKNVYVVSIQELRQTAASAN
jgi:integrase